MICCPTEGVVLLENPSGDNRLDMNKLREVCSSVFGTNGTPLSFFNGKTELKNASDLQALGGATLSVTSSPGSSPSPASTTTNGPLCPYVNLLLCNTQPAECLTGEVATLLLENPRGGNRLEHATGLLAETAKVFGLRNRRLKLYLDQDLTQGKSGGGSLSNSWTY